MEGKEESRQVCLPAMQGFAEAFTRAGGTNAMLGQLGQNTRLVQSLVAVLGADAGPDAPFVVREHFVDRHGFVFDEDFRTKVLPAYPDVLVRKGIEGVEGLECNFIEDVEGGISVAEFIVRMGGEERVRQGALTPDQLMDWLSPDCQSGSYGHLSYCFMIGVNQELFLVEAIVCHDIWQASDDWFVWNIGILRDVQFNCYCLFNTTA